MRHSGPVTAALLAIFISWLVCTQKANAQDATQSRQPELLLPNQRNPAADFSEKDIFNKATISLRDFRGRVVLLNFWATWCSPCREEIPALNELRTSYSIGLQVVGVSVYSYTTATEKFYKDFRVNYPMIYGSYELMGEYGEVGTIPTTFLVDKRGRIAARIVGARTRDQYEDMIKALLSE